MIQLELSAFRQPETHPSNTIVKKDDLGDFECSTVVVAKQAGLSVSETADLLEMPRHCFLGFLQGKKSEKRKYHMS